MTSHFTPEDAARWVAGVLDDSVADALEAHARQCPPCEGLLKAEARADERLTQLVREVPAPGVHRGAVGGFGKRLVRLALPLAAAAALVIALAQVWSRGTPAEHALLGSDGGGGFESPLAGAPHYERGAQIPPEALTANEPFPL